MSTTTSPGFANPSLAKYFRVSRLPHIWCSGCGHGIVVGALTRALEAQGKDPEKTILVSGIGCSSRATGYLNFNTLHTLHGRALAFATGVKMANPQLQVVVLMGDGDCTAIGGNHFIHAARRNLDLTALVFNNGIYGMTGGQYSPLSPTGCASTTSPGGSLEQPFDLAELSKGAGATYIARGTAYASHQLAKLILAGLNHPGFGVIETMTQCPTYYGRKNKMGDPAQMLLWQRDHSISVETANKLKETKPAEETAKLLAGKFVTGKLWEERRPEYASQYKNYCDTLKGGLN
jgi:2-oxoglutarate ferredoxin oxidoreductase subunit beta